MSPHLRLFHFLFAAASTALISATGNQTRYNPALPGWHSDPSCVFVPEWDDTTFCTSSTFLLTPGLPVHASKDLKHWKLASHALSRKSQYPEFDRSLTQNDGIWAPTIRYHHGTFYIITIYRNNLLTTGQNELLIFSSKNPYDDHAWSEPIRYDAPYIDPDLFWDDDGQAYVATAGTYLQTVDLATGIFGEPKSIWNGTTNEFLEGPHIYKKDGFYYLMVAEGGSGVNHTVTIARSKNITGPYVSNDANPILTNRGTEEYFQNVGHADLFHDARGQWWAVALAWRSGPEAKIYPMGRETVLTPVTWNEGEWPIIEPIRGIESGWYLPPNKSIPGNGPFIDEPDNFDFQPNSTIPRHLGYWRWAEPTMYNVSPPDHPGTLELKPSTGSITSGATNYTAGYDIANYTLIMRVQTDTFFQYSVDVSFAPQVEDEEVGVTVFLNQVQNLNLGLVMLPDDSQNCTLGLHLRFLVSAFGSNATAIPVPSVEPVPQNWLTDPIRLTIRSNETHYTFFAASTASPADVHMMGSAPAELVSGGSGPFTGMLNSILRSYISCRSTWRLTIDRFSCRSLCN